MTSFRVYLPFVSYIVARYSLSTLMACILVLPWRLRFVFQMSSVYNVLSRSVPLVAPRHHVFAYMKYQKLRFVFIQVEWFIVRLFAVVIIFCVALNTDLVPALKNTPNHTTTCGLN